MAQADSRQSLSKCEEEFLRRFSLRKFTVPIEKLSKQSIFLNRPKSDISNSDSLPQKRYHIEYKDLKRTLKIEIPWWLRAKGIEDDMNTERLVTLVEESVERVCSSKRLTSFREEENVSNQNYAVSYVSQAPSSIEVCNSQEKSGISVSSSEDVNFVHELFNIDEKSDDEEINEISYVEKRLSRVLRILYSLEGIRLDSGCEKCKVQPVTNDALDILTSLCAEQSCKSLNRVPISSPFMRRNLCVCNLQTVDNEIENLCTYIAMMMERQHPGNDPCNYKMILQRVQMIRKSLAEIIRKLCSEETSYPLNSPEMLQNIEYFIQPGQNDKTKQDSKKNKDKKKCCAKKSKPEKMESSSSKRGFEENLPYNKPCDCMKSKKGNFFTCCKKIETDCACNSVSEATSTKKISVEKVTFSQPLEIKGESVHLHERQLTKQKDFASCCKEVQTDLNYEPMPTSTENYSPENITCQPLNPSLFVTDASQQKNNFFACYKNIQTDVNGKSMLIPCLIFKQVTKNMSSSLPSNSNEAVDAANETELQNQYTTSYLRCKAEEALNNISLNNDVGNFLGISKNQQSENQEDLNPISLGTDTCICSATAGTIDERCNERPSAGVSTVNYDEEPGCCYMTAGKSNSKFKKSKTIKKSKSDLDQRKLQLNDESMKKEINLESVDQLVVEGDGNITCEFAVAPDVKLCFTTEPEENFPISIPGLGKSKNAKSTKTFPIQLRHRIHIEKIIPAKDSDKAKKSKSTNRRYSSCSCLPLRSQPSPSNQDAIMFCVEDKCEPRIECEKHESRASLRKENSKCTSNSLVRNPQVCRSDDVLRSSLKRNCSCIALPTNYNDSKVDCCPITTILPPTCISQRSNCSIPTVKSCNTEECTCRECQTKQGTCTCKSHIPTVKSCNIEVCACRECQTKHGTCTCGSKSRVPTVKSCNTEECTCRECQTKQGTCTCKSRIPTIKRCNAEECTCRECQTKQGTCTCLSKSRSNMSMKNKDFTSENYCKTNFCNLCIGMDIPIIRDDLAGEIRKIIGNRRRNSVFLKFTMVGGNLFHLQMSTDNDYLGCLYATQSATFQAREANGFDGCITLCVTDASNTLSEVEQLVDHAFMVVQQEKRCSF